MKVAMIAAPLVARSGVYRSSRELVTAARERGLDWRLVLGVSPAAGGSAPSDDPLWVQEFELEPNGLRGVLQLRKMLTSDSLADVDVFVSWVPQSDMALALVGRPWFAYLRALPWPAPGESSTVKRFVWKGVERAALSRAENVWATTEVLRDEIGPTLSTQLVPPGLRAPERTWDGIGPRSVIVWAARYNTDKNPHLFTEILESLPLTGRMHGSGNLEGLVRAKAPANVSVEGWSDPRALWRDALAYVGTSHREAFGRSAVEAAMSGVPVVLASEFGCAPLLYRDPALRRRFVLDRHDVQSWRKALMDLAEDEDLRIQVSSHLVESAKSLSVDDAVRRVQAELNAGEVDGP